MRFPVSVEVADALTTPVPETFKPLAVVRFEPAPRLNVPLETFTIAAEPAPFQLPRVPVTIGVAGGAAKTEPILGALRAGVVNTLVTDVRTAEAVAAAAASGIAA